MISLPRSTNYYTLIGSLPALPRHFEETDRAPISRLRLIERLKMLKPRDAEVMEEIVQFLAWERQPLELTDENFVQRYNLFMERIDNQFARELIKHTMTKRTIITGLRCRRLQLEPPIGVAPVAGEIARNWSHPSFRLGYRFPWIGEVDALLNGSTPFELQRKILDIGWQHMSRLSQQFSYTFEAVVLYLIRWDTVFRWTKRDTDVGRQRFEKLVTDAMGEYAEMF